MHHDFRKNTLATINIIMRKIKKLKGQQNERGRQIIFNNLVTDIQLIRSDLILILNQNFYLQCKAAESTKLVSELEQRCIKLEESAKLTLRMTTMKYDKLLRSLKYEKFIQQEFPQQSQMYESIAIPDDLEPRAKLISSTQQLPTPKKTVIFRNALSTAFDNKDTLQKQKGKQGSEFQLQNEQKFDLQVRVGDGIMSQQMTVFSMKPSVSMAKSNDLMVQQGNKRKKKGNNLSCKKDSEQKASGITKQEQLKALVAQQFKVVNLKEKYFSTDLL